MRSGSALLLVLLLGSLQLSSSAPAAASVADCCPKLTKMKIPLGVVESYTWTRSDCPFKAILFNTKAGRTFCVDPDAKWVKSHVAELKKRSQ